VEQTANKKQETTNNRTENIKQETETKKQDTTQSSLPLINALVADAGKDRDVIVGSDVVFQANAVSDAIYTWNFGDGTTARTPIATHRFDHSGTYSVVLTITRGVESVTDTVVVRASGADIMLRALPSGIEVRNNSRSDVDMSGWRLQSSEKEFVLPPYTIVLAGGTIALNEAATGIAEGTNVALLLPNNTSVAVIDDAGQNTSEETAYNSAIERTDDADDSETDVDATDDSPEAVAAQNNETAVDADSANTTQTSGSAAHAPRSATAATQPRSQVASAADAGFFAGLSPLWFVGLLGVITLGGVGVVVSQSKTAREDVSTQDDVHAQASTYEIVEEGEK
jgi:PKD repeat protein